MSASKEATPLSSSEFSSYPSPQESGTQQETYWKSLQYRAQEIIKKWRERKRLPPISLEVYFGAHGSAEDFKKVAERLDSADVFIPENCGWYPLALDTVRQLAAGKIRPDELREASMTEIEKSLGFSNFSEYQKAQDDYLYNSKKAIGFADISDLDHITNDLCELVSRVFKSGGNELFLRLTPHMSDRELEKETEAVRDRVLKIFERFAELQKGRENHIVKNLPHTIEEIFKTYPALKKKDRVRVLMVLGAFHTRVFHLLKNTFIGKIERNFSQLPFIYSYETELERRLMFKKPIDNSFLLHFIFEQCVYKYCSFTSDDDMSAETLFATLRRIVKKFSDDEIKDIFINQEDISDEAIRDRIMDRLKEKFPPKKEK